MKIPCTYFTSRRSAEIYYGVEEGLPDEQIHAMPFPGVMINTLKVAEGFVGVVITKNGRIAAIDFALLDFNYRELVNDSKT